MNSKYEAVIGLEVHTQLLTNSKNYSNDKNEYGALPNHNISAITLAYPGTLPTLNEKTIEYAIKLGLACSCEIREVNEFARKNYFYADLPKGYQITQDKTPICTKGGIDIKLSDGTKKRIGLTRIHIEEDSGKSIHDIDPFYTLVDYNRAGVPLLEIVSEPDLRSGEEAYQYLTEVRKLVRYLEICDGNLEEGSMRCDANISVRFKGAKEFGTKVEVKNMNSVRNVQRAIEFEINRQIEAIETGETIYQETRSFDAVAGTTFSMRSKEAANDYRYFPEPDLQPFIVSDEMIANIQKDLPALPNELFDKYTSKLNLSEYDAQVITDSKAIALFYESLIAQTSNYKTAANWLMGPIKSYLNENAIGIESFPLSAQTIVDIIELIDSNKISNSAATQKLFPALIAQPEANALELAASLNLIQESNTDAILGFVQEVIQNNPAEVQKYIDGKKNVIGFLMGQVMKVSKGKADPKNANQLLAKELNKLIS